MNSYAVIGSGMMGRVIAKDLLTTELDCRVTLLDADPGKAKEVEAALGSDRLTPGGVDVRDLDGTASTLAGHDVAIGALPHVCALDALRASINAGVSIVDLVGSKPELRKELDSAAREAGVLVIPGFGVAPGLSNVLIARGVENLDEPHFGVIYVGGIPVKRTPPLEYQTVYSLVSMFGAYLRPARIWKDGAWTTAPPLSGIERLHFPSIGALEAFYTDGLGSLVISMTGTFRDGLEEKTLRYPGFAEKVSLLNDCGLLSADPVEVDGVSVAPLSVVIKQVEPLFELSPDGDILVMRVVVIGAADGEEHSHTFELIDYQDPEEGDTAMARTTGYPATIAARMISSGQLNEPGVWFPEEVFLAEEGDYLLGELEARGVVVSHVRE
jgi:lysine 6-dehydrogenase